MSKLSIMLAIGATVALAACSRPAPEPAPLAAPVIIEQTTGKGGF